LNPPWKVIKQCYYEVSTYASILTFPWWIKPWYFLFYSVERNLRSVYHEPTPDEENRNLDEKHCLHCPGCPIQIGVFVRPPARNRFERGGHEHEAKEFKDYSIKLPPLWFLVSKCFCCVNVVSFRVYILLNAASCIYIYTYIYIYIIIVWLCLCIMCLCPIIMLVYYYTSIICFSPLCLCIMFSCVEYVLVCVRCMVRS
jgi:hypothetical protein